MKHTPGPWEAEWQYISAKVPGGRPNGEIIATFGPTAGSLRGKIPDRANALLAAASPDLRELADDGNELSEYAAAINWDGSANTAEWFEGLKGRIESYQAAYQKAIAKAEVTA